MNTLSKGFPPPGVVVAVRVGPLLRHRGIVSDLFVHGRPTVISNSRRRGRVVEESWEEFAGESDVQFEDYPRTLPPWEVVDRARSLLGEPWDLFRFNCDHVVEFSHGRTPRSGQVQAAAMIGAGALLLFVALNRGLGGVRGAA